MKVFLDTFLPSYGVLTLAVDASSTVRELKAQVEVRTRIPLTAQRFMWKGSVLADERTLLDAAVPPGATLSLSITSDPPRPHAAAQQSSSNSNSKRKTLRQHLALRRAEQALRLSKKPKRKSRSKSPSSLPCTKEGSPVVSQQKQQESSTTKTSIQLPVAAPVFGRSRSDPTGGRGPFSEEHERLRTRVQQLESQLDECDKKIHEQDNELSERERENARLRASLAKQSKGAMLMDPAAKIYGEDLGARIRAELARAGGLSGLQRELTSLAAELRERDRQRQEEVLELKGELAALRVRMARQDSALAHSHHQRTYHQQASPPPLSPMAIGATPHTGHPSNRTSPPVSPIPPVPHLNLLPKLSWESIEEDRGSNAVSATPQYNQDQTPTVEAESYTKPEEAASRPSIIKQHPIQNCTEQQQDAAQQAAQSIFMDDFQW